MKQINIKLLFLSAAFLIATIGIVYYVGIYATTMNNAEPINEPALGGLSKISPLPNEGKSPEFAEIEGWINSEPLSMEKLRGKVVLVDFWTYSCINCIRTLPYLSRWYKKYKDKGFTLVGVHSQEFAFEKERQNILQAVKKYGIEYPVAIDSNHGTWDAFANQYWPAHYLLDVSGNIRYHSFGEGHYAETETAIQQLLIEAGFLKLSDLTHTAESISGVQYQKIETPEIYLGYLRLNNVGNTDQDAGVNVQYKFAEPKEIIKNRFYFIGSWKIGSEAAESGDGTPRLLLRYKAGKVNMVLAPPQNDAARIELKLDGEYFNKKISGRDVEIKNGISAALIDSSRLYEIIDSGDSYDWHTLEVKFLSPGIQAFTFTFG